MPTEKTPVVNDGIFQHEACPVGSYVYLAHWRRDHTPDTLTGMIVEAVQLLAQVGSRLLLKPEKPHWGSAEDLQWLEWRQSSARMETPFSLFPGWDKGQTEDWRTWTVILPERVFFLLTHPYQDRKIPGVEVSEYSDDMPHDAYLSEVSFYVQEGSAATPEGRFLLGAAGWFFSEVDRYFLHLQQVDSEEEDYLPGGRLGAAFMELRIRVESQALALAAAATRARSMGGKAKAEKRRVGHAGIADMCREMILKPTKKTAVFEQVAGQFEISERRVRAITYEKYPELRGPSGRKRKSGIR